MATKQVNYPMLVKAKVRTPTITLESNGGTVREFIVRCLFLFTDPAERLAIIGEMQATHEQALKYEAEAQAKGG